MALIRVPKPPRSAYDPDRPVSSLLKSQIDHLREAESKLPLRYRSEQYVKAVRTEGDDVNLPRVGELAQELAGIRLPQADHSVHAPC